MIWLCVGHYEAIIEVALFCTTKLLQNSYILTCYAAAKLNIPSKRLWIFGNYKSMRALWTLMMLYFMYICKCVVALYWNYGQCTDVLKDHKMIYSLIFIWSRCWQTRLANLEIPCHKYTAIQLSHDVCFVYICM